MKTEFYLFRLPAKQVSTIPNATLCMYSTPAQPILPYAFKPRNYVIRFYSFLSLLSIQRFSCGKFSKRFAHFSPIFQISSLTTNCVYMYITNDSLLLKKFLGHDCNLFLMQLRPSCRIIYFLRYSVLCIIILYNLFYINRELQLPEKRIFNLFLPLCRRK